MMEATIVLWGGDQDGKILPLRAFGHDLPQEIYVSGPSMQMAKLLDNCPPVNEMGTFGLTYVRTNDIDRVGNVIYRFKGERQ